MHVLTAHCHCNNIEVRFGTALAPADLPLHACQCSFCRAHGAVTVADPAGRLSISVHQPELLQRYRFALQVTEFLICRRCGVYVAAVAEIDGKRYAAINARTLECHAQLTAPAEPMNYTEETAVQRRARRQARWTPVDDIVGACF